MEIKKQHLTTFFLVISIIVFLLLAFWLSKVFSIPYLLAIMIFDFPLLFSGPLFMSLVTDVYKFSKGEPIKDKSKNILVSMIGRGLAVIFVHIFFALLACFVYILMGGQKAPFILINPSSP